MSNQSIKEKFRLPKRFRKIPSNVWCVNTIIWYFHVFFFAMMPKNNKLNFFLQISNRSEFTALDKKYNPVNMGQGFSDAPPPQFVRDALNATINNPNYLLNQYARAAVRFNRRLFFTQN